VTTAFLALCLLGQASQPSLLCEIKDKEINESSGLGASPGQKGVWYTHNDSGDKPRFFRFDEKGKVTGEFELKGIKAFDWEDMAVARVKGENWIYLGDIGDNARIRKNIVIHRVKEPKAGDKSKTYERFDSWTIKYPDAAHDCEALMVHPATGDIWLVTKDRGDGTLIYRVKSPKGKAIITAEKLGSITIPFNGLGAKMVTAGDISPDGTRVAIRSYAGALEFTAPKGAFASWFKSKPKTLNPAGETQGEAIAYSQDGRRILTTSEGTPCRVSLVGMP
jgi:hypothetical protein